jgi:hypothetical protein
MTETNGTPDYEKPQVPAILLKPKAAAQALGIGERTLWELTQDGEIPVVNVGKGKERQAIRYLVEDLLTWAREHRTKPTAQEIGQEGIEDPPGRHRISNAET